MSAVKLHAYPFFMGNCREAMEFYQSVFGGELSVQTYDEGMGDEAVPENAAGKVMHASLSGGLLELMSSDSTRTEPFGESFISLSLSGADEAQMRELFDKLSAGGNVTFPIDKQPWGDLFGAATDKFGIEWMVNITA